MFDGCWANCCRGTREDDGVGETFSRDACCETKLRTCEMFIELLGGPARDPAEDPVEGTVARFDVSTGGVDTVAAALLKVLRCRRSPLFNI